MKIRPCPLCRQPTNWDESPWRPFCSARCQETDLGRWALESYRVALPGIDPEGEPEADRSYLLGRSEAEPSSEE